MKIAQGLYWETNKTTFKVWLHSPWNVTFCPNLDIVTHSHSANLRASTQQLSSIMT
jgi:hypothetical protein